MQEWRSCSNLTRESREQEIIDEAPLNGVVAFTELVLRRMGTYQLRFYSEGLSVASSSLLLSSLESSDTKVYEP